jgi:hypothetical protein
MPLTRSSSQNATFGFCLHSRSGAAAIHPMTRARVAIRKVVVRWRVLIHAITLARRGVGESQEILSGDTLMTLHHHLEHEIRLDATEASRQETELLADSGQHLKLRNITPLDISVTLHQKCMLR